MGTKTTQATTRTTRTKRTKTTKTIKTTQRTAKVRKRAKGLLIWAIDPFAEQDLGPIFQLMRQLPSGLGGTIQPVYVLSPDALNWTGEFSGNWSKKYLPIAERALQMAVHGLDADELLPAQVIINPKHSRISDVERLIGFCRQKRASMVVLTTHLRSGLSGWILGSFTETFLLKSKIPSLIVNPHFIEKDDTLKRLLVPTDLTPHGIKIIKRFLTQIEDSQTSVVIYHRLPALLDPFVQTGAYVAGGGWVTVDSFLKIHQKKRMKQLDSLAHWGRKKGIEVTIEMDTSPGWIVDGILDAAKKLKGAMIAMSSQAGGVSSILIGSVARQVIRKSSGPILVLK